MASSLIDHLVALPDAQQTTSAAPASPVEAEVKELQAEQDIAALYGEKESTALVDKLIKSVREKRPALRTDKNVLDWLAAKLKVTQEAIKLAPDVAWANIRDEIGSPGKEL